jgi:hybrid polyketide synthase/nonribosomal peptide synthetase ACE1
MLAVRKTFGEVSVSNEPPPTDGGDGYTATKWASERFLEKLNDAFPDQIVWIHRPSSILRPAEEELDEQAQFELLQSVLRFSRALKAVPERGLIHGYLDMVLVENASASMVDDALAGVANDSGIHYRHHTGDVVFELDYMKEYLENEAGENGQFETLPISEWTEKAKAIGLKTTVAALFENVGRLSASQRMFPKFIKGGNL